MKKILIIFNLFLIVLLSESCANNNYFTKDEKKQIESLNQSELAALQSDSILDNVENKIFNAFVVSKTLQNCAELEKIESQLITLNSKRKNQIVIYWIAYTNYYKAIHYLLLEQKLQSEAETTKGIELINGIDKKTSEHFALLSLLQNFSVQFLAGGKIVKVSATAKENGLKALELDNKNIRAYYVLALNDFYTPQSFGGGIKTEEYCRKAIELPNQSVANGYLPSWGKNLAYELLIKHYLKLEKKDLAKKTYHEAVKKYPNDYLINQLAASLID